MIKRVRNSFIKITMTMLTLMLIIPLCALNIITAALTYNSNKELLNQIAQTEIYILVPPKDKHNEPPPYDEFSGIEKQLHTTAASTTASTTTYTSAQTIKTTVTTVKPSSPSYSDTISSENYTKTVTTTVSTSKTQNDIPPWGNNQSGTMPPPPHWEDDRTKPYNPPETDYNWNWRPEHDRNEYSDDRRDYDFSDSKYRNYGAAILSPKKLSFTRLLASKISAYSMEKYSDSSVLVTTKSNINTTTTTTAVSASNNSINTQENISKSRIIHKKVFDQNIKGHEPPKINSSSAIDHFIVYIDTAGTITDVRGNDDYTVENCTELIENINKKAKHDGYYNSLQYVKKDYSGGTIVVFSDRQSDIYMMKTMLFVSAVVFILMEGIVFILTKLLTKRAMRPMQISYEKQQQFISDAGHELKTPLTVISANADILSDEIGENKWLSYIKSQTERMRILVQEMLDLTKITYSDQHIAASRFNISSLVENVALPFECQAFEQNKTFLIDLKNDIEFFGNTERIRRMIGIFIDNAFKYSNENGTIKIQLKTENNKKILKIYNTGIGIKKGEEEKIFERFYRSDSSRSAQSGYGLGLAIAKSIADQNNIKIQVQTEPEQWISFNLIF
ncbi:MAG: HAMP domain-containing histidine kinase [Ruminococcus sp.]|nr:HAMP domain-containing histidine kinase [Ruminococcus sp.]